jgi:hypothetical protein
LFCPWNDLLRFRAHLFVLGLSHILQPKAWVETFILIRGQAHRLVPDGLPYLILAAIVIAFHNVWSGIPVVLTPDRVEPP